MFENILLFRFSINLVAILIFALGIYYHRHHDQQMLLLLLAFNLFLFPYLELNLSIEANFGFTIFAILALMRLRSATLEKREIAYLLGAISLALINAALPGTIPMLLSNLLILITMYIGDHPYIWRDRNHQKVEIRWRGSDKSRLLDHDLVCKQLTQEYAVEVVHVEINQIRSKNGEARLTMHYKEPPTAIRRKRQAAWRKKNGKE